MNNRNIMAAILQTKGPIVTPALTKHSWKFLYMMSSKQFLKAAQDLAEINLGQLMDLHFRSKHAMVFVKKPPLEIACELEKHPDLCSNEYYVQRYNMPSSKSLQCISLNVRQHVALLGLAPAHLVMTETNQKMPIPFAILQNEPTE